MKLKSTYKFLSIAFGLIMSVHGLSQSSSVQWECAAKRIDGNLYELELRATLKDGWYIYSQNLPEDAINVPTSFSFVNAVAKGRLKEEGKLEKSKDVSLGIESWYFKNKVVFKGIVEVKTSKENINGSVEFQACTQDKCLPPARVNFSITINH